MGRYVETLNTINEIYLYNRFLSGLDYPYIQNCVIEKSICFEILAKTMGFSEIDCFVGINGSVSVVLYHQSYYLEFTFDESDTILFVQEDSGEIIVCDDTITIDMIYNTLFLLLCPDSLMDKAVTF